MKAKDKMKLIVTHFESWYPALRPFKCVILGYIDYQLTDLEAEAFIDQLASLLEKTDEKDQKRTYGVG